MLRCRQIVLTEGGNDENKLFYFQEPKVSAECACTHMNEKYGSNRAYGDLGSGCQMHDQPYPNK